MLSACPSSALRIFLVRTLTVKREIEKKKKKKRAAPYLDGEFPERRFGDIDMPRGGDAALLRSPMFCRRGEGVVALVRTGTDGVIFSGD